MPQPSGQSPVSVWAAQIAGTIAITIAIYLFFGEGSPFFSRANPEWMRFGLYGILAAAVPALSYIRKFAAALDADIASSRARGGLADPGTRGELLRRLRVGGVLCELPLAVGAIYLMAGGERRWFLTAAAVTLALRLSYRPFRNLPR